MSAEKNDIFFCSLLCYILTLSCSGKIECICENTVCQVTRGKCVSYSGCFTLLKEPRDNVMMKGCLGNVIHMEIICKRKTDYPVICCHTNYCNQNITIAALQPTEKTDDTPTMTTTHLHFENFFVITGALALFFLAVVFLCWCHNRPHPLSDIEADEDRNSNQRPPCTVLDREKLWEPGCANDLSGQSGGLSLIVQRTIARQLTLLEAIGSGTYGEVWHARWRDRDVAVKVFLSHCESSWKRETEIYQTVSLRHESILGFIASDITSGTDQQTNMYIITDYHPFGSLCDFLKFHTLSADIMTNLALSASKGLSHLHTEIQGTIATGKPAMAHRDISSNNILVKANLTCCLADFGLAVRHSSETEEVDVTPNRMVGTRIYMAPEVLGDTMNFSNIGAFKMADIYSFGLVLWEMNRRCCSDDTGLCEEFQRPYLDLLPSDPSFEDVKKVVLTERKRPSIPTRWEEHEPLRTMTKVMTECWAHNPAARLTALRVQKAINKLKKSIDSQIDDMNNDNTTGRHSMILSV